MKRKQFKPEIGKRFWCITTKLDTIFYVWDEHFNLRDFRFGMYKTKKDAESALKELKAFLKKWRGY